MGRAGVASLPLHGGKAPRWLFDRMVKLASAIFDVMLMEHDAAYVLQLLADPFWFQALSCVLGFDWHSSGTTTVTCGALKEALADHDAIRVAGGKGSRSHDTLDELGVIGDVFALDGQYVDMLRYTSRMAAKVDNAAVQDGYHLYHHCMLVTRQGDWAVIQQGMHPGRQYARRYHWLCDEVQDMVEEPHSAVLGERRQTMNMTARDSHDARDASVDLLNDGPRHLRRDWKLLTLPGQQTTLDGRRGMQPKTLHMPRQFNWSLLKKAYELQPSSYEDMLAIRGIGPSTVRALAYIAALMYGSPPAWRDPARYSFAVGGKDGIPYPVNRRAMDEATALIREGVEEASVGTKDKLRAVERLKHLVEPF
ncbi:MAG: DUF763 domain-containing protein [Thermoplasmatota archaeon]